MFGVGCLVFSLAFLPFSVSFFCTVAVRVSDRVIVPVYIPVSQTLDIKIGSLSPGGVSWSVPASLRALGCVASRSLGPGG